MVDSEVPFSSVLDLVSTCLSFPHKNLLLSHPQKHVDTIIVIALIKQNSLFFFIKRKISTST